MLPSSYFLPRTTSYLFKVGVLNLFFYFLPQLFVEAVWRMKKMAQSGVTEECARIWRQFLGPGAEMLVNVDSKASCLIFLVHSGRADVS